nr:glycosyl hydrolase [uncultured Draconibacterium sp.]
MKLNSNSKNIFFALLAVLVFYSCQNDATISDTKFQEIKKGFQSPTDNNTLWCYWYWINDDISKEGITKDLLAMKEAGIGAALIGNINPAGIDGKVPMLSEDWWAHMVHAVTEGKRIGVDIGIFNCPGWSQSGGPWVDYTKAMRYLTYSETKVTGPAKVNVKLVQPQVEFQDTHTLAFLAPADENRNLSKLGAKVDSDSNMQNLQNLVDGDLKTSVSFKLERETEISFDINLSEEMTARQISITPGNDAFKCSCSLYAEIDGEETFVKQFEFNRSNFKVNVGPITHGDLAISLNDVKSRRFRLECKRFVSRTNQAGFAEINISEAPVLEKYIEKQLGKMLPTPTPKWNTYIWDTQDSEIDSELIVDAQQVIDVSEFVNENGQLVWNAPQGEWTIIRIGMSPTGTKNSPSAPQGQGYEIDKMNRQLAKFHFDNFVGEFLKRIPEESKSAFKYVIADSYEMGSQNWTDGYEIKFREKFGYDPVKYLPVLSGRIVGSVEESERFLWDLRRSVADDVAYEYVGGLRKASNEHNLQTWLENYGHWGFPSEFMMYGGQSDLIAGEFWNEGTLGNIECKASSSTSHTYGKGRTSAEAFTASRKSYLRHPAMLKKRGDWSFTEGINHLVLHLYIQQPDDNRMPGMNAWFSTEFNRHNTWFSQADNYFDYLRRCQHLLQQGQYAADVCYFIGENAPIMTGGRNPEIPKGYTYDYINGEVILDRLSVKDGKFVLPDGMSYSVMVLPPVNSMRPEILAKLEQMVQQGGVILGQKPEKSPSLQNYPRCDEQVQELAAKLWAGEYVDGQLTNKYGEGLVLDGQKLSEVFSLLKLKKDVDVPDETPILWTHRTMPGMDIYFITNQSDEEIEIKPVFRVNKNLKPQLWDAVSGEIGHLNEYTHSEAGTTVPIKLKPEQSWFVVFCKNDDEDIKAGYAINFPEPQVLQTINKSFTVDFLNKEIGPAEPVVFEKLSDWSKSTNDKIKYYSGTAVYSTAFNVEALPDQGDMFLNLSNVSVMAEVKLNGQEVGGVWIAPYRLNVSGLLKQGENTLEVEVVNLWRNQMIKDKMLPEDERYTWTVFDDIKTGEEPHTSGLLGPVTIEIMK